MKLIRAYANRVVANVTSDGILPWSVEDVKSYIGKSRTAGF